MLSTAVCAVFGAPFLLLHYALLNVSCFPVALPSSGVSLERLHAAYHAHAAGGGTGPLLVDGCPIEDLCLTFQLPGYPQYPLHPDGAEVGAPAC